MVRFIKERVEENVVPYRYTVLNLLLCICLQRTQKDTL